jgi:hypothetical protein
MVSVLFLWNIERDMTYFVVQSLITWLHEKHAFSSKRHQSRCIKFVPAFNTSLALSISITLPENQRLNGQRFVFVKLWTQHDCVRIEKSNYFNARKTRFSSKCHQSRCIKFVPAFNISLALFISITLPENQRLNCQRLVFVKPWTRHDCVRSEKFNYFNARTLFQVNAVNPDVLSLYRHLIYRWRCL